MDEFWHSIANWFKEKTTSPFYGTFFMALVFWNWKIFYVLFFENTELIGRPKIEYVSENFLSHFNFCLWEPLCVDWFLDIIDFFLVLIFHVVPPFGIALFLIWIFPRFTNRLHKKSLDFHFERQAAFRAGIVKLEQEESAGLKKIKKEVEEQAKTQKEISAKKTEIKESKTKEQTWDEEFESLKTNPRFPSFEELGECIYGHYGKLYSYREYDHRPIVPFFHSNEIVSFDKNNASIELTEKGKYFMRKYLNEKKS